MKLGIIGGGQLGRMLALAARPLDIDCLVVEPAADPPAGPVSDVIQAPFDDPAALDRLARECDVVTVELEGVPVDALARLAERVPVHPSLELLAVAQDRLAEKRALRALGIATAPFDVEAGLPAIVKTRRGGYDGRGQVRVSTADELAAALAELPEAIVEGVVPFVRELSVIAARGASGEVVCAPLVENVHRDGILRRSIPRTDLDATAAEAVVGALLERYDVQGVITVELFDTGEGLVANEIAPRVHNSGHWTIEGAVTSQFSQHVRAVCGLPLGAMAVPWPCAMVNLIGSVPPMADLLAVPGASVHLYGKEPRPARKVGHVTVVASDDGPLAERIARLEALCGDG